MTKMKATRGFPVGVLLVASFANVGAAGEDVHWPSFRGLRARGVAEGSPTAVHWDAASSKNIRWKTRVPGLGHSSPVIWGDRIYLITAVQEGGDARLKVGLYGDIAPVNDDSLQDWRLLCMDKRNGEVLWEKSVLRKRPRIKRHPKSSHANSTPATDGSRVVSFFGSEGLYCYSSAGKLLWKKDLGTLDAGYFRAPEAQWGFGSSPVIHDGKVIVQCDVQDGSFIGALDLRTGDAIWRQPRRDVPTWSTPTVCDGAGRTQVIVNGFRQIGGYDVTNGEELWTLQGGGDIPVPTPVVGEDLIYITNAHGGSAPIYAIRKDARGQLRPDDKPASPHIAWFERRGGNYMQTPILYGDHLFSCTNGGILSCRDAKSGQRIYRRRLASGSGFTASPVASGGKIYYASEQGTVYVVKAGAEFQLLAENSLGETCMATPAISEGVLFFRTRHHLMAVAERAQ